VSVIYKVLFLILFSQISYSQIIPSFQGVYDKKSSSDGSTYVLDFDNDDTCTSNCTNSFYGEIGWNTNMSSYTVSIWVKSGSSNPGTWRGFFNCYSSSSDGFQLDSDGSGRYRFLAKVNNATFGNNSITTTWNHLAVTADGSQTKLYYNGNLVSTNSWVENTWNQIEIGRNRNTDRPGDYFIDEVRVWNTDLTQSQIQAWMHKTLDTSHDNYSNSTSDNLKVYFQMSSSSISGTTLSDQSANDNDATLYNAGAVELISSYVPISDLNSSYETNVEAIWSATGANSSSDASNGLTMSVSSTLSEENFAVFGNNNTSNTSTSDLPSGTVIRSARIWQMDKSGTVSASVIIDISDATGNSPTVGAATNYKLLHRIGTSGNFTSVATGGSVSSDNITFSGVTIHKGFYVIAATESSNL
jgi:hypothetical protein